LETLNKKDINEIKSYAKPPTLVEKVLEAVMILRGSEPTWAEAKRHLGEGTCLIFNGIFPLVFILIHASMCPFTVFQVNRISSSN